MSKERLELLNRCASSFFAVVEDALLAEIQLTLSRLADPPKTGGHKNATLEMLLSEIQHTEGHLAPELRQKLDAYQIACKKVKYCRNKYLAHFNYATLVNSGAAPLDGPSRQELEEALESLRVFMNQVESHFNESYTAYERFISRNDGEDLLFWMKRGLRYKELEDSGDIGWDDLRNSPLFRV